MLVHRNVVLDQETDVMRPEVVDEVIGARAAVLHGLRQPILRELLKGATRGGGGVSWTVSKCLQSRTVAMLSSKAATMSVLTFA